MKLAKILVILMGVFSMTVQAQNLSLDEGKIRSNINSFSTMADQGAFEYLGRLFAPAITVDYTSLFGGEAQQTSNLDLMKQWSQFLPGFDATFHDLSNVVVSIAGDKATVTADITASHWLGKDGFWAVSGSYDFKLIKTNGDWLISSMKINAEKELGSRDVLARVAELAKANHQQHQQNKVNYQ